ncbi:hypothetical protein CGLO_14307 [Colletotrichum gloeosporioides Cg-14]|uniref:Uncharacterized protein n=1 Tax=Colletotrichum gloeosporioides (strain Cg-14) TaxID=1237896 RepID=T0K477_COLGC|nr:hypothetical protein CGLO_14307 [Colletotrichum gloeosporioides Cg-14]
MSVMESHATKSASEDAHDAVIDVPTSSIDAESLSYRGSNGWLDQTNLTIEQMEALIDYLCTKYDAVEIGRLGTRSRLHRPGFIYDTLVIELTKTDFETFHHRLVALSSRIRDLPLLLRYNNGPLLNSEHTIDSGAARNHRFMSMGWRHSKVVGARGSFVQQTAYADQELRNADTAGEFIPYSDVFDPLIEIDSEVTL